MRKGEKPAPPQIYCPRATPEYDTYHADAVTDETTARQQQNATAMRVNERQQAALNEQTANEPVEHSLNDERQTNKIVQQTNCTNTL